MNSTFLFFKNFKDFDNISPYPIISEEEIQGVQGGAGNSGFLSTPNLISLNGIRIGVSFEQMNQGNDCNQDFEIQFPQMFMQQNSLTPVISLDTPIEI